jgi:hypothetical protein
MRHLILYSLIGCCILVSACKKELSASSAPTNITIQFADVVNTAPLVLNTTTYTNFDGEEYTVTAFKYYISNIQLISINGTFQAVPGVYHLVDAADSASQSLSFGATADSLVALTFLIGVDSAQNVSGTETGDLTPTNGMFWSSSAGYIMAKLEGTSPASTASGNVFLYDIGGFTGQYNVLRTVTLALPGGPFSLNPAKADTLTISLSANVNTWFKGPHVLTIGENPTCTAPGMLASEFADNYAMMFTVTNVQLK